MTLKQTPLFEMYGELGAKTVEFGGWNMPVSFQGILDEHQAVRTAAGVFDVSHMGEFEVIGKQAMDAVQYLVTNNISKLQPGAAMYTLMVNEHGGTIDDLLVYCFDAQKYWLVVNAGNIAGDLAWVQDKVSRFDVEVKDISDDTSLIALQGPKSIEILSKLTTLPIRSLPSFQFLEGDVASVPCVVSATGYTGELGFELYVSATRSVSLFRALLDAGREFGAVPCGLGARDTLRLEARLPLYGHELNSSITPLEAGLGMFVKFDCGDFIGRDALLKQKEEGVQRKLAGFRLLERGIARSDASVHQNQREIGKVTSGTMSPTLKSAIGLALIARESAEIGNRVEVEVRGKLIPAEIVRTPFYKRVSPP